LSPSPLGGTEGKIPGENRLLILPLIEEASTISPFPPRSAWFPLVPQVPARRDDTSLRAHNKVSSPQVFLSASVFSLPSNEPPCTPPHSALRSSLNLLKGRIPLRPPFLSATHFLPIVVIESQPSVKSGYYNLLSLFFLLPAHLYELDLRSLPVFEQRNLESKRCGQRSLPPPRRAIFLFLSSSTYIDLIALCTERFPPVCWRFSPLSSSCPVF